MANISEHISRTCVKWLLLFLVCDLLQCIDNFNSNVHIFWFFFLGMKLTKAYAYLADVKDHKRVIPFRRFSGGVGRASQAKEFKATQGA